MFVTFFVVLIDYLKRERDCTDHNAIDQYCTIYKQTHNNDKERLDILNGKVSGNSMGLSMTGRNDSLNATPNRFAISHAFRIGNLVNPTHPTLALRTRHQPTIIPSAALQTNTSMHVNVTNVHNSRYY